MQLPTNKSFQLERAGVVIAMNLSAFCQPARPEIIALQDVPAAKAFEIVFPNAADVREQDVLRNQLDATDFFRVRSVAKYLTPRLPHTEVIAEGLWGTE
ncbi:MAG: hypothetical protein M3Q71_00090 [Chloroflexota bacterium]|nr:hypothetical protein [Chloroflexota bacterium]